MTTQPATEWRTRIRAALLAARKDRDGIRVSALRSVLAAIDNAETPDGVSIDATSETIAGGVAGVGSAEVARRQLSDTEIRDLLTAEVDERVRAAQQFVAGGHTERAATLRAEADVITAALGDV